MTADFHLLTALLIFAAYLLVDALYAYYTLEVVKLRPYRAATMGALMHFLLAFGVLNYVNNPWYLLPLAAGSWVGTYAAVWREKQIKSKGE